MNGIITPYNTEAFGKEIINNEEYSTVGIITFNDGIEIIGENAFKDSARLYSIYIPDTVMTIGNDSFAGCDNCCIYNFGHTRTNVPTLTSNSFWSNVAYRNIVVPDALYDEWIAATNWNNENIIKNIIRYSDFMTIKNRPLKFTAEEPSVISFSNNNDLKLYKSTDGIEWTQWDFTDIELDTDEYVYIKGYNLSGFSTSSNQSHFNITGGVTCEGDVMSLVSDNYRDPITDYLFNKLFYNNTGLLTAPEIHSKVLTDHCFEEMFRGCSKLRSVQDSFDFVTVKYQSCRFMFGGCTSLINAANVSYLAGTVGHDGLVSMYSGCTSLVKTMDSLNATTLEQGAYSRMFEGCTSLKTAMEIINATHFNGTWVMDNMFYNCINLENAPILPAKTLNTYCYEKMFYGCAKINYIECHAENATAGNYMSDWVHGVASTGTFVKNKDAEFNIGNSGIPTGWTITDRDAPLTFTSTGNSTVSLNNVGGNTPVLYYSLDDVTYHQWDYSTINLQDGESVYLTGINNANALNSQTKYSTFVLTGSIAASGNIMSLLGNNADLTQYCFYRLFFGCTSLTTAPELPATELAQYCYSYMFSGCTNLTKTPILPAKTLVSNCYSNMFAGCTSLNTVTIEANNISATGCLSNWLNNVASTGNFKKINTVNYPTSSSGIPSSWTACGIFYLVNRKYNSDSQIFAWHGSAIQEQWIASQWTSDFDNVNYIMYVDSNNYVLDYLTDRNIKADQPNTFGNLKLYSATDTDGLSVFVPCGYNGTDMYRCWIAKYAGQRDYANKGTIQEFINTWGYRKNSTFICSYEKMYV